MNWPPHTLAKDKVLDCPVLHQDEFNTPFKYKKNRISLEIFVGLQDGVAVAGCNYDILLPSCGSGGGGGHYPSRKWGEYKSIEHAEIFILDYFLEMLAKLKGKPNVAGTIKVIKKRKAEITTFEMFLKAEKPTKPKEIIMKDKSTETLTEEEQYEDFEGEEAVFADEPDDAAIKEIAEEAVTVMQKIADATMENQRLSKEAIKKGVDLPLIKEIINESRKDPNKVQDRQRKKVRYTKIILPYVQKDLFEKPKEIVDSEENTSIENKSNGEQVPDPELFIAVDPDRLKSGGDIFDSMSADLLSKDEIRKPFQEKGKLFVATSFILPNVVCYEVVPVSSYAEELYTYSERKKQVKASKLAAGHKGQCVKYMATQYVLTNKTEFTEKQVRPETKSEKKSMTRDQEEKVNSNMAMAK